MEILIPISICCILPIVIVTVVMVTKMYIARQRSEIIIKAIEVNNNVDVDKLAASLTKPKDTPLETLNKRLLRGCIFTLAGIGIAIVGLIEYLNHDVEMSSDSYVGPFMLGFISFAIGLGYLITYFVTKRQIKAIQNSNINEVNSEISRVER